VRKVNLNRAILPLSVVVEGMVHFLLALPVIIVFLAVASVPFAQWSWFWQIPLLVGTQLLFTYPLALLFSVANVFVHDIEYLVGVGFALLFFATPMVYPITMVPPEFRPYFELNPLHALISGWRSVLLDGVLNVPHLLYCLAWGIAIATIALAVYRRYAHRLGELL
jgi:lipopolysaccharide transport system permease protein